MSVAAQVIAGLAEQLAAVPIPAGRDRPAIPLPKAPPKRRPDWEVQAEQSSDAVRTACSLLATRVDAIERRLVGLKRQSGGISGTRGETRADETVEELGASLGSPRVSVLLRPGEEVERVGRAMRSLTRARLDGAELVVVDDGSTDTVTDTVREAAEERPRLAVRLVRHHRGGEPDGAVWNAALAHARAELVFILDPNGELLPNGLDRLVRALDSDDEAAFAYGLTQTVGPAGPAGVTSWMDWSADRLRYGSYLDDMALFRRAALVLVGGYPVDAALEGWEGFAVWIALADAGRRGVRVPEFVGRRHVDPAPSAAIADIDPSRAWTAILRRHPELARPDSLARDLSARRP